jgi:protein CWC15
MGQTEHQFLSDAMSDKIFFFPPTLQKIKKERANERVRLDAEKKVEEERIRTENILKGNPLLNKDKGQDKGNFNVKRR